MIWSTLGADKTNQLEFAFQIENEIFIEAGLMQIQPEAGNDATVLAQGHHGQARAQLNVPVG